MEKSNSQYDSFLFWRQPIPALDVSELADLGLTDSQPANSIKGKDKSSTPRSDEEEVRGRTGNRFKQLSVRTVNVIFLHQHRLSQRALLPWLQRGQKNNNTTLAKANQNIKTFFFQQGV